MRAVKSVFVLAIALVALNSAAQTTIPVPISEDTPLRLGASVSTSTIVSPFSFRRLEGILGVAYGFGGGFEGGFNLRGGGVSQGRLFQTDSVTNSFVGADMMLRYLGNITGGFYMGLQASVGYDFIFAQPDITSASNLVAFVGIPVGVTFGIVSVYAMPVIDFGRRQNPAEGIFGSLVGLGGAIGSYVTFGFTSIYLEVKPKAQNISASDSFALEGSLGLAFEI